MVRLDDSGQINFITSGNYESGGCPHRGNLDYQAIPGREFAGFLQIKSPH